MVHPLRILLTSEEKLTLSELRKANNVPQRTKDRAHVLLLNASGWKLQKIADCFNWNESTVRQTLHRWQSLGLAGLWDAPRSGKKRRWQEADLAYLEECLQQQQAYNMEILSEKLKLERQVNLSPDRIRRVLKQRGNRNTQKTTIQASRINQKQKLGDLVRDALKDYS